MAFITEKSYVDAAARLPKNISAALPKTLKKYLDEPNLKGLHREKLHHKSGLCSLRVNDGYRIVFKNPEGSDSVILLYVGNHEDAYEWADRHTVEIGSNNALQLFESHPNVQAKEQNGKPLPPLRKLSDAQLLHIQVPSEYWPVLREKIFVAKQLIAYKAMLSEESYYVLEQALQGFDIDEAISFYDQLTEPINPVPVPKVPLFAKYDLVSLAALGVPEQYLDQVNSIKTEEELKEIQNKLPEEATQNLYALYNGESIEVLLKKTKRDSKSIDPVKDEATQYKEALNNPITKQTCVVIDDFESFQKMLDMPMEKWRLFLHPEQRHMVDVKYQGPARLLGGAGTGKTVVIVHRAKKLASECAQNEKVLVTTYSKTLAEDITIRLKMICNQTEMAKIIVTNIDSLVNDYVERYTNLHIKYNFFSFKKQCGWLDSIWDDAIERANNKTRFNRAFFEEEWKDVIQANNITSIDQYLESPRSGRGAQRLDQQTRRAVWDVFMQYHNIMQSKHWIDIDYAENVCTSIFNKEPKLCIYKHILIDECQDLRAPALRMLRALAGPEHENDLFFAGDSRQRIYDGSASFSQCGINVRGRSTQIKLNYRTTNEIYNLAYEIQKEYTYDDMDDNLAESDRSVCVYHGEAPVIKGFASSPDEFAAIAKDIQSRIKSGYSSTELCVVSRTTYWVNRVEKALTAANIPVLRLDTDQTDDKSIPGVRIATMHRVKGMEFDGMYLAAVNKDIIPVKSVLEKIEDSELKKENIKKEANLVAVAMTRARRFVWTTYAKEPSTIIKKLIK